METSLRFTCGSLLSLALAVSPLHARVNASGAANPITIPSISSTKFFRVFKP
jgi:hypothetical protein